MDPLYDTSIAIIKGSQSESGAYIACPNYPVYQYCWLRDGSFIAHAMDAACEFASAEAFFCWVGRTIRKYGHKVEEVRRHLQAGLPIGKDDVLHTRYTLSGDEVTVDKEWGNFQIDGYGTWLWALAEHVRLGGDTRLLQELEEPVQITLRYLELVWRLPNYDCWEEHPEFLHPFSLASTYAGFDSIASLIRSGQMQPGPVAVGELAAEVKRFILQHSIHADIFAKHIHPGREGGSASPVSQSGVDSSLVGIATPFQVLPPDDPRIQATVAAVDRDLRRPGGGVYRYRRDVFYGGGEWPLLTAWLGWHYARTGRLEEAEALRLWIESQADPDGCLAEQINAHPLFPGEYDPWLNKWGPVAKPLLWSHAMYIILVNAIRTGVAN
jgi:GH15 family glucan-1,4-alpha-glucosidase